MLKLIDTTETAPLCLHLCGRLPAGLPGVLVDEVRSPGDGVDSFFPGAHALDRVVLDQGQLLRRHSPRSHAAYDMYTPRRRGFKR